MRCSIVAELSCNHKGQFKKAIDLIKAAKESGADAVKVQMFRPNEMTLDCDKPHFVIGEGLWQGKKLYDLYVEAQTPIHWIPDLMDITHRLEMSFLASVYHPDMVDIAETFGIKFYKVSSFELNYTDLLVCISQTRKPVILSTGMASEDEIKRAIDVLTAFGSRIAVLKCTSEYPAALSDMNLITIIDMVKKFGVPVGLSDHTRGIVAPMVAVSYGACIIEKHLTLDKDSLDGDFSVSPNKFAKMVKMVKAVENSIGEIKYGGNRHFRRSAVAIDTINEGDPFTRHNTGFFRTVVEGNVFINETATKNYEKGDLI